MTCRMPPSRSCAESSSWSSWRASPSTGASASSRRGRPDVEALGWWGVPLGVLGGAIRASTPFLFVSLGECLTEKSGRINLGLEGTLVMGAMRSEEHTSELQSLAYLVCRLLLEKKKPNAAAATADASAASSVPA